ncbi:EpsG family protein [Vibrio sp. 10N.286.52.C3]|uniref:EpsG family protein n=1 Tax=Vibrio sp. 10N.286.52.C3 TaxID=3229713 RepID=UPI00354D7CEE
MFGWFIIILLFSFLSLLFKNEKSRFIWFILACIGGFRFNIGTDFHQYVIIYNQIIMSPYLYPIEPGYKILVVASDTIGGNPQLVFLFTSILTMYFLYKGFCYYLLDLKLKSYSYIVICCLFFVLYFYVLTSVRQALALSIFFYSSKYIIQKKFYKFSLALLLSSMFHTSVIFFLPLYFFANKKYSNIKVLFFLIFCVILVFVDTLPIFGSVTSALNLKYARYFMSDFYTTGEGNQGSVELTLISITLLSFIYFIIKKETSSYIFIANMILVFIFLRVLALDMDVVNRLSNYIKPFMIVFIVISVRSLVVQFPNAKNLIVFISFLFFLIINSAYLYFSNESFAHLTFNLKIFGEGNSLFNVIGNYDLFWMK